MTINIIVAVDSKNGIGKDNKLPWHIPEDLKRFRQLTMGNPIIMGRKTHESIGRVLEGRTNYVVSHKKFGLSTTIKLASFHEKDEPEPNIFIIGGASIYKQVLDMGIVDTIYMTKVIGDFKCDTFFPELDMDDWIVYEDSFDDSDVGSKIDYAFIKYKRVNNL